MTKNQHRIPPFETGYEAGGENRARHMRRDNDTVKIPKISLYDVDYAIIYHLSQNMKLSVLEGDKSVNVPVIYADGEKWAQIRSRGFLRDEKKKLIAPLIAIRRDSIEPDSRLPMVDLNNYVPYKKFFPYRTMNMQRDRISGQLIRKPSYEWYMVDMPNYVQISYDVVVWTYLIEQLNGITQAMIAVSNHMWGDYYTFRTNVNNISINTSNNVGEDRVVSANISLTVDAGLQEEYEYHEPTMRKAYSVKTVKFENEREETGFYLEEPDVFNPNRHISQEPKHLQLIKKRRNLRWR